MNAIQQKCRPKHQVLVLKCYPRTTKGAVDVKPNSSELSYLLFYATSRRSKIQKIGAFLEKKTASDVWRQRIGNVQVTLRILTALIEKAPKDLPLVAPNVLKILDLILGSKDITMVESSLPTFEAFCNNHDASSSFADQAYLAQYESIVRSYASLASARQNPGKGASSKPVLMRWRNAGLEAIKGVSSSEALSSVTGRQFDVIVPVILDNLWDDNGLLDTLLSRIQMEEKVQTERLHRRTSVATVGTGDTGEANPIALTGTALDVDKLAEEDIGVLAMQCLKQIFVAPNRPQIHSATTSLLQFVEDRVKNGDTVVKMDEKTGKDHGWAISIYSAIARWAPVQDRYVILITAMDHIAKTPVKDDNIRLHLALAAMIGSLLRSDINLIGLSAMDVLLSLVQHMKKLIHLPGGFGKGEGEAEDASPVGLESSGDVVAQRRELLERIQLCIGDLATHVYYADQISDMISTILLRLKPSKSSSASSSPRGENAEQPPSDDANSSQPPVETYLSRNVGKIAALKAIKNILLVANPRAQMSGNLNLSRNKVPIQVWENTHWLLRDPDGEVRKTYVDALLTWLDRETTAADLKARDENAQHHRSSLKNSRELQSASVSQRAASNASNREKPSRHRSHFLQLLHIAIYDNALQYLDFDPDIVLLHVLLTKLVSQLGVNAVQYGLPMVFRLQEDIPDAELPVQKVRLGSLCHGYFWAVTEKFDIENSAVGRAITNEVIRRRTKHFWTEGVAIPPPALELIGTPGVPKLQTKMPATEVESEALLPFDDRDSLVESIAVSYADSSISPPSSPPQSPGRNFSHPILNSSPSTVPEIATELPAAFRERMIVEWSRDTAMMALQAGSKSESLAGSKSGTMGTNRQHLTINGANGHGQTAASSPFGSQHNLRPNSSQVVGGLSPVSKLRKSSVRSGVSPSPSDSSRGAVASVDHLKMILAGQLPATPLGTSAGLHHDSDSDSMVSYDFTPSELSFNPAASQDNGDGASLGRQRSSSQSRKGGPLNSNPLYEQDEGREVPPVPPLPNNLATMNTSTRIPLRLFASSSPFATFSIATTAGKPCLAAAARAISTTPTNPAEVAPVVGAGPPPEPPIPNSVAEDRVAEARARVERRRKQAEMLKQAQNIRAAADAKSGGKTGGLKRRFWNDVSVKEVDGALEVHLDARPLRHPNTKKIIRLPPSKQHLASALAIEWDLLTSAQQATKQHLIPLTSLVCRALDIAEDDAASGAIREQIATTVMRYLDTDSLLCWAPPPSATDTRNAAGEGLRDVQKRTAQEIVGFLTARVWPGLEIGPVLDGHSIMPRKQNEGVREVVQGWVMGLDAWEIAGLERAVLAGKSLITAARLVVEWSEGPVGDYRGDAATGSKLFGIEEAATASSLEVSWQIGSWGEVEDTHDVEREDLRRQLGSVVLLVSGTNRK
ncbi:Protein EFR3 [Colletotrichum chlorophyti]|uniref:Protein EFR3 n=1 Tax=Colletotrichum chlorophyti TaxID=708187 RepID=A0A1Q8S552_9PEZI|nr:Protein EFR3 [Colletotrichum chlorophyti]